MSEPKVTLHNIYSKTQALWPEPKRFCTMTCVCESDRNDPCPLSFETAGLFTWNISMFRISMTYTLRLKYCRSCRYSCCWSLEEKDGHCNYVYTKCTVKIKPTLWGGEVVVVKQQMPHSHWSTKWIHSHHVPMKSGREKKRTWGARWKQILWRSDSNDHACFI